MHVSNVDSNQQICIHQGKTEDEEKKYILNLLQPLSTQHTMTAPLKAKLTKANLLVLGIRAHKHDKQW